MLDWLKALLRPKKEPEPPSFGGAGATTTFDQARLPRGLRNNNPGNIRGGPVPWKGEVGRDPQDFVIFSTAHYGLRALAKLLITYRLKYNLDCVEEIIGRWAPTSENNTRSYVNAVARELDVSPTATLNVTDPTVLGQLVAAIVRHENGAQPYSLEQIDAAVADALEGA